MTPLGSGIPLFVETPLIQGAFLYCLYLGSLVMMKLALTKLHAHES